MSNRILPVDRTSFSAAIGVAISSCHFLDVCQHIWGAMGADRSCRLALQNAASIAGLILTTDCVVVTPSSAERAHIAVPEEGM